MSKANKKIVVIGGGVIGITTATALLEYLPEYHVEVIAEKFSPGTTGDGAAGFWGPYVGLGTTPEHKIIEWSQQTWSCFSNWWRTKSVPGVSLVPGTTISPEPGEREPWAHIPIGYKELSQEECSRIGQHYKWGCQFTTFTAEPRKFLPHLLSQFESRGGKCKQMRLGSLNDVAEKGTNIIMNCSGIGAKDLVSDQSVYPIRGQLMRVRAPWIKNFFCDESANSCTYIIPNIDNVVLGGTIQEDDWRLYVDPQDSALIYKRCTEFMPSLKEAKIVEEWVGLRPGRREGVRLETEELMLGKETVSVVHNYGHGGCGITLSWGCALEAANLAKKCLERRTSKL